VAELSTQAQKAQIALRAWRSQLHPPFVEHIVESSLAAIVDGKLATR
jgi:hypothetical protein